MEYRDRVVVVTGASSGIGRAAALAFARRGARVVGVARRGERLRAWVEACEGEGLRASFLAGDLGERAFAEHIVEDTVAKHGRLDVLVNNAGIPKHKRIYHLAPDEAEQVMRINFLSSVWSTLAVIPHMLAQGGGTIVNVSSFAALVPPPHESLYAASKAAMNAFSAGLWTDLAGSGIHVGIVNPGAIDTEIWHKQDEPNAFGGRKHPPEVVVEAILECVDRRRHELIAPRRSLPLGVARLLRSWAPGLLRWSLARFDPVPAEVLERARARARGAGGGPA